MGKGSVVEGYGVEVMSVRMSDDTMTRHQQLCLAYSLSPVQETHALGRRPAGERLLLPGRINPVMGDRCAHARHPPNRTCPTPHLSVYFRTDVGSRLRTGIGK